MFVDYVELELKSGKGGNGAVSFRREKFVLNGGPDGGDGGNGGDVIVEVSHNTDTLSHFRGCKVLSAKNGSDGGGKNQTGKRGEDLLIKVPPGTQIFDLESGKLMCDLTDVNDKVRLLKGGNGGFGNARFKTSVNQRPTFAKEGLEGERKKVKLELKLIADVGLVGYPNVGKSTLISVLSNAKPEIANYEFTTIIPNLGVVDVSEFESFVMADIPGIIDGSSTGRGLGLQFLRHIERTRILLYVLDAQIELKTQISNLRSELLNFSQELAKRECAIVVNKIDMLEDDKVLEELERCTKDIRPAFIMPISALKRKGIIQLKHKLYEVIKCKV